MLDASGSCLRPSAACSLPTADGPAAVAQPPCQRGAESAAGGPRAHAPLRPWPPAIRAPLPPQRPRRPPPLFTHAAAPAAAPPPPAGRPRPPPAAQRSAAAPRARVGALPRSLGVALGPAAGMLRDCPFTASHLACCRYSLTCPAAQSASGAAACVRRARCSHAQPSCQDHAAHKPALLDRILLKSRTPSHSTLQPLQQQAEIWCACATGLFQVPESTTKISPLRVCDGERPRATVSLLCSG